MPVELPVLLEPVDEDPVVEAVVEAVEETVVERLVDATVVVMLSDAEPVEVAVKVAPWSWKSWP